MCIRSGDPLGMSDTTDPEVSSTWEESGNTTSKHKNKLSSLSSNCHSEPGKPVTLLEFGFNLPSSIVNDTEFTNKPFHPRIVTIKNSYKARRRLKRKNKVRPSVSSESLSASTDDKQLIPNSKKRWQDLILKYWQESPDLSPNDASSPPCNISTCSSQSPACLSATTIRSSSINVKLKSRSDAISKPRYSVRSHSLKMFNPIFSSSLEVPRKYTCCYEFPAISKITTDFQKSDYNIDVKDESPRSEMRDNATEVDTNSDEETWSVITSKSNKQDSHADNDIASIVYGRREQSKEMAFYVASSTESGSRSVKRADSDYTPDSSDTDDKSKFIGSFRSCCFPKRQTHYFT